MIKYKCTKCGAILESPKSMARQEDKCPLCGHICTVPESKGRMPLILGICGGGVAVVVLVVAVIWLWPPGNESAGPPGEQLSTNKNKAPSRAEIAQRVRERDPEKAKTAGLRTESVTIDGRKITIEFTNPDSKGRTRLADVITFGNVWKDWSAILKSEGPLKFDETRLGAGTYRLFVVPESTEKWQLIVSKNQEKYDKKAELVRVVMDKGSSGSKEPSKDMEVYVIRVRTQPVDLGISLLRMCWLDAEVETLFFGGMTAK